ncbi:MAG: thioredoxin-disulfide reductase [Pseudobdellovibrionaceae bacterium]
MKWKTEKVKSKSEEEDTVSTQDTNQKIENTIIIGSGPAGLTAAVYTARARLEPLMIEGEEAGGQLMITTEVENYPGFEHGVTGPDLISVMRKQAQRFGTRFITRNVSKVDLSSRPFKVWIGDKLHLAKTIIISTGASAKYLGLPSEKQYANKGVSACATCDGAFFRDMDVAVIGGGDTAMEEANFLTRFAKQVYLVHRRDSFRASKIMAERAMSNSKIKVLWNTEVTEVLGDGQVVTGARLKDTKTGATRDLAIQGFFLAIGHKPNTEIFKGQLDMNEVGYLKSKPGSTYTNIPGVFAAGDVQDPYYRQAITAAGTGCMAAIDTERWLEAQH